LEISGHPEGLFRNQAEGGDGLAIAVDFFVPGESLSPDDVARSLRQYIALVVGSFYPNFESITVRGVRERSAIEALQDAGFSRPSPDASWSWKPSV
jgi:hypothetical protein